MSGVNLILLFIALFGFLPLAIIILKRKRDKKILSVGLPAKAIVYDVRTIPRSAAESISYHFQVEDSTEQYTGRLVAKHGLYKTGDSLDIFYLRNNPRQNTMDGAWGSPFIFGFGIIIAVFILFAVYKMYEMVKSGSM